MGRILALSLAVLASVMACGTGHAQTVTARNPQSVANVLQKAGYRAELTKDDSGDPMIRSASSGTNFIILFYGCKDNANCTTIQFFAGYSDPEKGSLEAMNEWNAQNRFGRAYLSDKGAARLEMDLDLDDGGMSAALFEDNLEFWITIMTAFEKFVSGG